MKSLADLLKVEKTALLRFLAFCLGAAALSAALTGSLEALVGLKVLLLPVLCVIRSVTLLLFVLPALLTPARKTAVLISSALWFSWLGIAMDHIKECLVMAGLLLICALAVYISAERQELKSAGTVSNEIKSLCALSFGSFVFIMIVDMFQTASITVPFHSMFTQPDVLGVNLLYFTAIGAFVIWARKPVSSSAVYLAVWLVLAIGSLAKVFSLYEPVLILDVFSLLDGIPAAVNILGIFGTIGVCIGIVAVIAGIVILFRKEKKRPWNRKAFIIGLCFTLIGVTCGVLSTLLPWIDFSGVSPKEVFNRNGYVYSFITTGYRSANSRPDAYMAPEAAAIIKEINTAYPASADEDTDLKNIVIIQMESFLDPYRIEGAVFERDPIPYLRSLSENYSSGTVNVPTFGGQTVKSEFELLSGMSLENLPYGYSPYVVYLDDNCIDSFPRYLRSIGFTAYGLHDYQGEFFSRNTVYQNLGFSSFTSYEFMSGVERKDGSIWANDRIILEQMKLALDTSSTDKNFFFAVTVQTHGKYPVIDRSEFPMEITGIDSSTLLGQLEYYVSQLEQLDRDIQEICEYFEERGEPTMILMYSDHLPTFARGIPGVPFEDRFQVNFYTWNNIGLKPEHGLNMELYTLTTFLCDSVGLDGSEMNRFHRMYRDRENYKEALEMVQYYKMFEEDEEKDFSNPDYRMGVVPLKFTDLIRDEETGYYTVKGTCITEDTYLCVNGRVYDLDYIDPNTAILDDFSRRLGPDDVLTLRIIGTKYGGVLAESDAYDWR